MRKAGIIFAAVGALVISGCTVGPNYVAPKVKLPEAFEGAEAGGKTVDMGVWWKSLGDPELDSLVERAVRANDDLEVALMRLQESRAQELVLTGGMLPYVDASGAAARGTGNNSTKGRIGAPLNAAANTTGLTEITQVVGFDAGWEIDFFGRFWRQLEAARADTQAAAEARNAVLVAVIADVARAYVDLRAAQLRLGIAQESVDAGEKTLDVVQQRFDRGLTNELDVALAKRQLATARSTVAPLGEAVRQAEHRLAVLIGQTPESLDGELKGAAKLPEVGAKVIAGVPAELLGRRPDIRQAERRLAAQNARVGVATADLFPRLVLTAGMGLQGQGLGKVPMSDMMIWSAGPAASMPILDFGRIDSTIMAADFQTRELYYRYEKTVLGAVEEVDNAAGSYAAQRASLDELAVAVEASKRAVTLATGRYERGLIDFLNVLDAQRQLYGLEDQYTQAQQAMVVEYVAVYKALGGGWESFQEVPGIRRPLPAVMALGKEILERAKGFGSRHEGSAASQP